MEYIRKDLCCCGRWSRGPPCVIIGLVVWGLYGVPHVLQFLTTMDSPASYQTVRGCCGPQDV